MTNVFDGHNDALLRLWTQGPDTAVKRFKSSTEGHIDLARAKPGGMIGGFFAMFSPPTGKFKMPDFKPPYDYPLPPMLDLDEAGPMIEGQLSVFEELVSADLMAHCRNYSDLEAAVSKGKMAGILHMEGAEAIGPDLMELDQLYARGLRSLGPVWSRPTIFGHGVPFKYPSDGDIGPGLTDLGKKLVDRCKALGVIVDTAHLNVAGFWDVAEAGVPLVATHSNSHKISPGARNLTDEQLRAIGETGGMVGLNFGTMFLREDGCALPEGGIQAGVRHVAHMIEHAGEDHVGLGSDFDGAPMPTGLDDVSALPNLFSAFRAAGFDEPLIEKIANKNWFGFIKQTLG